MFWLLVINGDPSGWEKEVEIISQAPTHFAAALIALFVVIVLPATLLGWSITSHITRKHLKAEFSGQINGQSIRLEIYKEKITELEKQLQAQNIAKKPEDTLTPQDYKCLEEIYRFEKVNPPAPDTSSIGYSRTALKDALSLSEDELSLVIENLKAQRLIRDAFEGLPVFPSEWSKVQPVVITQRGQKVIEDHRASS